jgi:hypothetical protein
MTLTNATCDADEVWVPGLGTNFSGDIRQSAITHGPDFCRNSARFFFRFRFMREFRADATPPDHRGGLKDSFR